MEPKPGENECEKKQENLGETENVTADFEENKIRTDGQFADVVVIVKENKKIDGKLDPKEVPEAQKKVLPEAASKDIDVHKESTQKEVNPNSPKKENTVEKKKKEGVEEKVSKEVSKGTKKKKEQEKQEEKMIGTFGFQDWGSKSKRRNTPSRKKTNLAFNEKNFGKDYRALGLSNCGNTCYLNASLQVLFRDVNFQRFVWEHYSERRSKKGVLGPLGDLLFMGRDRIRNFTRYCAREAIGASRLGMQYDSFEFIEGLLNNLEDDTGSKVKSFEWGTLGHTTCKSCKHVEKDSSEEKSFFLVLTASSIQRGVENLQSRGLFMEDEKCTACGRKALWLREPVTRCPKSALIRLDRVDDGVGIKIDEILRVPNASDGNCYVYKLYGTVIHQGGGWGGRGRWGSSSRVSLLSGGHYVAAVRKVDDEWFHISDSSVYKTDLRSVRRGLGEHSHDCSSSRCMVAYYQLQKVTKQK